MDTQILACPVCTLFLREGMTMQSHLNTHPKDQVIDALVRLCSSGRTFANYTPPAIVNPFQVVSEEHIFLGRQQVTTNIIHAPFMSYPVYQNPQIVSSTNEFNHPDTISLNVTPQEAGTVTTLVNYSNDGVYGRVIPVELEEVDKLSISQEHCTIKDNENEFISTSQPQSPSSLHDDLSHLTDDEGHHSDGMMLDDMGYDVDDIVKSKELDEEELNDHDHSISDLNIQADEKMPARGELSGQESIGTEIGNTASSVWIPETQVISERPLWGARDLNMQKTYPCLYCNTEFPCPKERRVHVATVHSTLASLPATPSLPPDSKSFQKTKDPICLKCGLQLEGQKQLKVHMRTEHKRITRQCKVCGQDFLTAESYAEHLLKIHPLECRTCGKTFPTRAKLGIHAKIHMTLKPYSCTLCTKSFITNQKLKEHMNGHTGFAPIKCNMCDKTFKRYSNLKQHKDNVHTQVKKKSKEYFCECGETFITKKKLKWHKETHEAKPKQCMYCSERYIHLASLTRHIRRAHDSYFLPKIQMNGKKKNVTCPICNSVFLEKSLRVHMKQHNNVKQHGCIVCGKRFLTKWNLTLHRWTHASRMSKPYKCTLCKGAFIRHSELQAHIRAHYGAKPYTCNHCGRQFNRKHNWQRHEREHIQEKKYTCAECGKTFHRSYYLVEHSRIHTGVKPYSCHICNKTSATKSNHNKHVRTHHAREAINSES